MCFWLVINNQMRAPFFTWTWLCLLTCGQCVFTDFLLTLFFLEISLLPLMTKEARKAKRVDFDWFCLCFDSWFDLRIDWLIVLINFEKNEWCSQWGFVSFTFCRYTSGATLVCLDDWWVSFIETLLSSTFDWFIHWSMIFRCNLCFAHLWGKQSKKGLIWLRFWFFWLILIWLITWLINWLINWIWLKKLNLTWWQQGNINQFFDW